VPLASIKTFDTVSTYLFEVIVPVGGDKLPPPGGICTSIKIGLINQASIRVTEIRSLGIL